ncbi:tetratricopeptide repeat protein [Aureivirga sp. CE67]|uniref:tetratricopeptide repeat protein n=1 Tax=Aureivirga sp. CE67 TaxID=1788983 RepID=UPI0018CA2E07|nr:tetratricopeptide repeat protein [Aureivirga sp. CE67]
MHKLEKILIISLILLYLSKIIDFSQYFFFYLINFLVFILLSIFGFKIYKSKAFGKKSTLIAVYSGIAIGFGVLSFSSVIRNLTEFVAFSLMIPNFLLFVFLSYNWRKSRKNNEENSEKINFIKKLWYRSSSLILLLIVLSLTPLHLINIYINKDVEELKNRGLRKVYIDKAKEFYRKNEFEKAIHYGELAIKSDSIGSPNDTIPWGYAHSLVYKGYKSLILKDIKAKDQSHKLKYFPKTYYHISKSYGSESEKKYIIQSFEAQVLKLEKQYEISDSLFIDCLNSLENSYKGLSYTRILHAWSISLSERGYNQDAKNYLATEIDLIKKDTTTYNNQEKPEEEFYIKANDISEAQSEIARIFQSEGKFLEADSYYKKAFENEYFNKSSSYLNSLSSYGYNLNHLGKYKKAKEIFKTLCKSSFEENNGENFNYLSALRGLNTVEFSLSNFDIIEKNCKKGLEINDKISEEKNEYYYDFHKQLGEVYIAQAKYDKALQEFRIASDNTEYSSFKYAVLYKNLSETNLKLGDYTSSLEYAEKASSEAFEQLGEKNNPYYTSFAQNEAYVNYTIGKLKKSKELYELSYSNDTLFQLKENLSFSNTLNGLGLLKFERNKLKQAETLFENSKQIIENKIGQNNFHFATILHNQASLEFKKGNNNNAKDMFAKSTEIIKNILSENHDLIADNYFGLGEIAFKEKKYSEALEFFEKSDTIYKSIFKNENIKTENTQLKIEQCKKKI